MLDTDICIYIRRRRPASVTDRLRQEGAARSVISVVTYAELRVGAEKGAAPEHDLAVIAELTSRLRIASLPTEAGEHYAAIRAHLERRGEIIGNNDLWIAAHARAAGLTLVTNNEREFRRVPDLKVENWAAAA